MLIKKHEVSIMVSKFSQLASEKLVCRYTRPVYSAWVHSFASSPLALTPTTHSHSQGVTLVACFTPFHSETRGFPWLPPTLFLWPHLNWRLYFSTLRLGQKVAVSPSSRLALAWRISGLPPSLNATARGEHATTSPTNTASGWQPSNSRSSLSVLLPQKRWKRDSFEHGSAVAKCAWRTCRKKRKLQEQSLLPKTDVEKDKFIKLFRVWWMGEPGWPEFYRDQVSSPGVWWCIEEGKTGALQPLFYGTWC